MKKLLPFILIFLGDTAAAAPINYVFSADNPWIEVVVGDEAISAALTSSASIANIHGSFIYDSTLVGVDWAISEFKINAWAVSSEISATAISLYKNWWNYPASYSDGLSIGGALSQEQTIGDYSLFFAELQFWQTNPWFETHFPGSTPSNLDFLQDVNGFLELCFSAESTSSTSCLRVHNITVEPAAAVPLPSAAWLLLSALLVMPKMKWR